MTGVAEDDYYTFRRAVYSAARRTDPFRVAPDDMDRYLAGGLLDQPWRNVDGRVVTARVTEAGVVAFHRATAEWGVE